LEGVRGGLGAKKCYGTRCFFFKLIFPQKYWGKNEGWPFLLLTKQLMAQMFD